MLTSDPFSDISQVYNSEISRVSEISQSELKRQEQDIIYNGAIREND